MDAQFCHYFQASFSWTTTNNISLRSRLILPVTKTEFYIKDQEKYIYGVVIWTLTDVVFSGKKQVIDVCLMCISADRKQIVTLNSLYRHLCHSSPSIFMHYIVIIKVFISNMSSL